MRRTLARTVAAIALTVAIAGPAAAATPAELARWRAEAARATIVRDDWGIAHVHGKTDADAVFGMIYAQAEDDFPRVETNYVTYLGLTARAKGESAIWQDLRQRLWIDPADLQAKYRASPAWLRALMDAWADGLNYYLATHPETKPAVITHFEPWMTLAFSEGSIGGDIERVDLKALEDFYGHDRTAVAASGAPGPASLAFAAIANPARPGLQGSNGIAIAPKNTVDGHALLLINPHTSFFFRSELQMSSDEGLDAYGAATWGQFFIYQGFNPHVGWMHTSSGVDNVDQFAETVTDHGGGHFTYAYGAEQRPVIPSTVTIDYKAADGSLAHRSFTVYRTHHGPIVREADGKWIAFSLMNTPVKALEQSFLRTKASDYASYMKVAALAANSSNNTLFADDKGQIAYLHPQFVPVRDNRFDYTHVVDGSDPATDWRDLTPLDRLPSVVDPPSGYVFNTNDWPYNAAGPGASPRLADFPRYMDRAGENPRGVHAARLLAGRRDFSQTGLMRAAFDPWMPAWDQLIPPLVAAWDALPQDAALKEKLAAPVADLKGWDHRWGADSTSMTLAAFWGEALGVQAKADPDEEGVSLIDRMARTSPQAKLETLASAVDRLTAEFGDWRIAWGEVNRFQRINDNIKPAGFTDAGPSIPVPFTTSRWGSLAAFEARPYPGTKKWYGTSGNSFVAVVEFGPRVSAVAVTAGGESGHPGSPHFDDEAGRYASGQLRKVYFWPDELEGHEQRTYHPGA
ncbi:MAG TPA: penicillin acylase family protein [Caulobacteraceae bacterium]|jgi:acyl-homoserine-lactone acylase